MKISSSLVTLDFHFLTPMTQYQLYQWAIIGFIILSIQSNLGFYTAPFACFTGNVNTDLSLAKSLSWFNFSKACSNPSSVAFLILVLYISAAELFLAPDIYKDRI